MPPPRPVPEVLRGRPFMVAEARERGVTTAMLEGARFRQLLRGVHVESDVSLSLPLWLQAALLVLPADATVTCLTGLHAHEVNVGAAWPLRLATCYPHPVRRERVRLIRANGLPQRAGRVASAEHCFASACAELDLVDAVTAGDWLVHLGHTTPDALRRYAHE